MIIVRKKISEAILFILVTFFRYLNINKDQKQVNNYIPGNVQSSLISEKMKDMESIKSALAFRYSSINCSLPLIFAKMDCGLAIYA